MFIAKLNFLKECKNATIFLLTAILLVAASGLICKCEDGKTIQSSNATTIEEKQPVAIDFLLGVEKLKDEGITLQSIMDSKIYESNIYIVLGVINTYKFAGFEALYGAKAKEKMTDLLRSVSSIIWRFAEVKTLKAAKIPLQCVIDSGICNDNLYSVIKVIKEYGTECFKETYHDEAEQKIIELIKGVPAKTWAWLNYETLQLFIKAKIPLKCIIDAGICKDNARVAMKLLCVYRWEDFKETYHDKAEQKMIEWLKSISCKKFTIFGYAVLRSVIKDSNIPLQCFIDSGFCCNGKMGLILIVIERYGYQGFVDVYGDVEAEEKVLELFRMVNPREWLKHYDESMQILKNARVPQNIINDFEIKKK